MRFDEILFGQDNKSDEKKITINITKYAKGV